MLHWDWGLIIWFCAHCLKCAPLTHTRPVITFAWISHILLSSPDNPRDVLIGHNLRFLRKQFIQCSLFRVEASCAMRRNFRWLWLAESERRRTKTTGSPSFLSLCPVHIQTFIFPRVILETRTHQYTSDQVTALARGRSYSMFCPIKSFDHVQPHLQ